jgi:hypothetical protein
VAAAETRDQKRARLEAMGVLVPDCPGCEEFYAHPDFNPFAPRHRNSSYCESGKRPHCTCDACF